MVSLSELLRRELIRSPYNIRALARLSGVSVQTIYQIKRGERAQPETGTLKDLARALRTDAYDGRVDERAFELLYARLLIASGYISEPLARALMAEWERARGEDDPQSRLIAKNRDTAVNRRALLAGLPAR